MIGGLCYEENNLSGKYRFQSRHWSQTSASVGESRVENLKIQIILNVFIMKKIRRHVMKRKFLKLLLISILSMISVYSKADCDVLPFKENYLSSIQSDKVLFIKGVALGVFEHGRTIKIIEDLKGNFAGESSIFVWGGGYPTGFNGVLCTAYERTDNITRFQENDTLIMLVKPVIFEKCFETLSDYTTLGCRVSVLKLSNGYVTLRIGEEIETVLWEELKMSLTTEIQLVRIKDNK